MLKLNKKDQKKMVCSTYNHACNLIIFFTLLSGALGAIRLQPRLQFDYAKFTLLSGAAI